MEISDALSGGFESINWLSVVIATLLTFVIGGVWYHEKVLGTKWMNAVGLKKRDIENANMVKVFGVSFVLSLLTAVFLAISSSVFQIKDAVDGSLFGALIGTLFVVTSLGTQYTFAQRSFELFAIDASYIIVTFAIMGSVIGAW